ncbi:MAG: 6,7-dimethyl-8-ribityllumazine synthase [Bdellovibrionota bacterium]|nr:MAG: 6,7-dimethyl-8-ribityllumazine synthase [Pseudomonadota bacterium]
MSRILIVAGQFNDLVGKSLVDAALKVFKDAGKEADVDLVWVPGAFEIPVVTARAARSKKYAAIVTLGAVIRGETPHFEYVSGPCASAVMGISVETGVPVVFGVLTVNTVEQALNRAGLKLGNKGAEAAHTALQMIATFQKLGF